MRACIYVYMFFCLGLSLLIQVYGQVLLGQKNVVLCLIFLSLKCYTKFVFLSWLVFIDTGIWAGAS